MTTFKLLTFIQVILLIVLFIGLKNPAIILRRNKKPTKLKVFIYWLVLFISTTIVLAIIDDTSQNKIKRGVISIDNINTSKILVDAFYQFENYDKEKIESYLNSLTDSLAILFPNKKIDIFLYSSNNIRNSNRSQFIATSGFGYSTKIEIDYNDDKLAAFKVAKDDNEFNNLELYLKEHNTSVCEIYSEITKIAESSLENANEKYNEYSKEHGDYQEKTERQEITKLFSKYNIPDSIEYKIVSYSINCK